MTQTAPLLSASGRELPKQWFRIIVVIWAGQAVSIVTSYAASYAAIWYVTETTGSAFMLAVAGICAYLPQGLISPFGGMVADRFNRRTVMVLSDGAVGLVSLGLGLVILFGQASFGLVLVMVVARSVGMAFHGPAMMAAMPMLVPEKHLLRINMLDQLVWSAAGIGAPAFGILLYTAIGFYSVMFLDFGGALFAVGGLLLAKIPTTHDASADGRSVLANLREGWSVLAVRRGLVALIVGTGLAMVVFAPLGTLFPLMVYNHFSGDGYMASLVEAVYSIGTLAGSAALLAWGGGKHLVRLVAGSIFLVGLAIAACGLLAPGMFIGFVVLCAVMAFVFAGFNGPFITIIQHNVSEEKQGRALGLIAAVNGLASPAGVALGGVVAQTIGIAAFFFVDGLVFSALGAGVYALKNVRSLDKPAE